MQDAEGRTVRVLMQQVKDAGTHSVAWDGKDNSGDRAAAGVYRIRFSVRDYAAACPVVLMR